jgi:hypothetical protein
MYDPAIGKWLSEDSVGFQAADENLYRYARNDPTNATDPSGLTAVDHCRAILAEWQQSMRRANLEAEQQGRGPLYSNEQVDYALQVGWEFLTRTLDHIRQTLTPQPLVGGRAELPPPQLPRVPQSIPFPVQKLKTAVRDIIERLADALKNAPDIEVTPVRPADLGQLPPPALPSVKREGGFAPG